jgi:hypothetical protein
MSEIAPVVAGLLPVAILNPRLYSFSKSVT